MDDDVEKENLNTTSNNEDYDLLYKVILVGDYGVGKTSLLQRYENPEQDITDLPSTIGFDFRLVDTVVDSMRIRVQLWDTMGQERFRTITKNFFRQTKGVLLLYDVTRRDTLNSLGEWINSLKQYNLDKGEVIVVGNKVDLEREVSFEEGKRCAFSHGVKYVETSAMTGENVDELIEQIILNMKDTHNPFETGPKEDVDTSERKITRPFLCCCIL